MPTEGSSHEERFETRAAIAAYGAGIVFYLVAIVMGIIDLITGRSIWDLCVVVFAASAYNSYMRSKHSSDSSNNTMFGVQIFAAIVSLILFFVFK